MLTAWENMQTLLCDVTWHTHCTMWQQPLLLGACITLTRSTADVCTAALSLIFVGATINYTILQVRARASTERKPGLGQAVLHFKQHPCPKIVDQPATAKLQD